MNRQLQDEENYFEARLESIENELTSTRAHLVGACEELHDIQKRHLALHHNIVMECVHIVQKFKGLGMGDGLLDDLIAQLLKELNGGVDIKPLTDEEKIENV